MAGPGRRERIEGDGFAVEPLTPWLVERLARARATLARALAQTPSLQLREDLVVRVGAGIELAPDLAIVDTATSVPKLVLELRRDSTDRFALGIKRLAYGFAGIPHFWFIEPRARELRVLQLDPATRRYGWPGVVLGPDDRATAPGGSSIAVDDLL